MPERESALANRTIELSSTRTIASGLSPDSRRPGRGSSLANRTIEQSNTRTISSGLSRFVNVAIPLPVYGTFTYAVPLELQDDVRLGTRVEVPWGPKVVTAFVVGFSEDPAVDIRKVREIRSVLDDDEPALLPEIIQLCLWAAEYYIAPPGEMLRVALPANMSSRGKRRVRTAAPGDAIAAALAAKTILEQDVELLSSVERTGGDYEALVRSRKGAAASLRRLRTSGLVEIADELHDAKGVRYDRFVSITPLGRTMLDEGTGTAKQRAVLTLLASRSAAVPFRTLVAQQVSEASIGSLQKKGAIAIETRPRQHTLDGFFADLEPEPIGELSYSAEQVDAIVAVRDSLGTFAPFLLQGVTGSGKTEVYIEIMREVVKRGEQVIVLVPEISLTPILAARLRERFGDRIAILHSNLSPSERYDQWWRSRRGQVDVTIGPRSALFTPFPRLGLIVVDEEGDAAYKQEETPRYNARDLAVVRAQMQNVPVILGSATPSLESRENAERGKYTMLKMAKRVESRPLPEVEIVDIRGERGEKEDRGLLMFGQRLREELVRVFDNGEQAIILMNRRGYAPFLLCRQCENDFRCRDCSVTMTVHRRENALICHYCGLRKPIPVKCPLCQGEVLQPIGFGTEKVEERFRTYFPEVTVEVLDRDVVRKKGELVRRLGRFDRGETQALIGTQMISKGHHFPKVTLTAVINADAILGYPDFRSAEKTFYLLTQVAGRSGRGALPGRVLIQSAFPHHYALQHAVRHDYDGFFKSEIEFRRRFKYPPVTSMIAILIRGEDAGRAQRAAEEIGRRLEAAISKLDVRMQGPAPAPLSRLKGVHRFQILLRSSERAALRKAVEPIAREFSVQGVDVTVDVDPINIL